LGNGNGQLACREALVGILVVCIQVGTQEHTLVRKVLVCTQEHILVRKVVGIQVHILVGTLEHILVVVGIRVLLVRSKVAHIQVG